MFTSARDDPICSFRYVTRREVGARMIRPMIRIKRIALQIMQVPRYRQGQGKVFEDTDGCLFDSPKGG